MKNKLKGSRAYLAGPIDYAPNDGVAWRRAITPFLHSHGIVVIDPTNKPISDLGTLPCEIGEEKRQTLALRDAKKFDELKRVTRKIRSIDLRMTDIADFLIVYLDLDITMCGTWEELFNANRQKKPILVVVKGGAKAAPLWLHGTIDYKYIFSDFDELMTFIADIDDGSQEMDGRWTLLDHLKLSGDHDV